MMPVIELQNGVLLEKKSSKDFWYDDGELIEPEDGNNCYTYALGTWVLRKPVGVYINPGFTVETGFRAIKSRSAFIQKVLQDCDTLGIDCTAVPISGKSRKIKSKLQKALEGDGKVLLKAFWAPPKPRVVYQEHGYYHFVRRIYNPVSDEWNWIEQIGLDGFVMASPDDEPIEQMFRGRRMSSIAYFVVSE